MAIKITPENSRLKIRGLNSSTPEIAIKKSDEPLGVNEKSKETVYINGSNDEISEKLIDIFKNEIKVIN